MFKHVTRSACVAALLAAGSVCLPAAAQTLRDPTRPEQPVQSERERSGRQYELSAIFFSDLRRVAIVNGRTVVEGQSIDGAQVLGIERDRVELAYRGRRITVVLARAQVRD